MSVEAQGCVKWVNVTPPVAIKDNASWSTTEVDTLGFDYLEYIIALGATDIAVAALKATEGDTTGQASTDITGAIFGTSTNIDGSTSSLPSATDDNKIFVIQLDLRRRKRFIDLTFTAGDGTSGTYGAVIARLSRGHVAPLTAAAMGASQVLRV